MATLNRAPATADPAGRRSPPEPCVIAVNGGSSSIKFALFAVADPPRRILTGGIERIGMSAPSLQVHGVDPADDWSQEVAAPDHATAVGELINWFGGKQLVLAAVGHRVVHGGPKYCAAQRITADLVAELRRLVPLDSEHLPAEILLIEAFQRRFPDLPQVACFDTEFHQNLPRLAQILPIPRRYEAQGIRRYGFHGLSYAYLMEELSRQDAVAAHGRVILAHLGNGASLAAVAQGRPVDTSMGFTPTSGLVMGSRSGDLDPGLLCFLAEREQLTPTRLLHLVNHESGMLGVSQTSSDLRDLLAREAQDPRAAEAVELFCYQARKWIGAFAAALGGIDTLVFAGGIGENAPLVRERICGALGFLGIAIDRQRNALNAPRISADGARVGVRVIPTDEQLMIVKSVISVLGLDPVRDITP